MRSSYEYMNYLQVVQVFVRTPHRSKLCWHKHSKRLPNNLTAICAALSPYQQELFGVVESTYNWYWLVDGLMEAGYFSSPGPNCVGTNR